MSSPLARIISDIVRSGFVAPPADEHEIVAVRSHSGIPDAVLQLYRLANGLYLVDGNGFPAPNGKRNRYRVCSLDCLRSVANYGYVPDDSPLFERLKNWWQFFDCGDANWVGMTDAQDGFRIVDVFHETVGVPESHSIIAESLLDFLEKLVETGEMYWLNEGFEKKGVV